MARLLITGMNGFVGRHVAMQALQQDHDVRGFDVGPPTDSLIVTADLRNAAAVRDAVAQFSPELVIHLAGLLRSSDPQSLYEIHVVGTANLLDALVGAGLRPRVVVASSSAVYGDPGSPRPISEDTPLRPLTHYGASKAAQEIVALRYQRAMGMPVIVARSFNVTGPGQPPTLATGAFAEQIARAEHLGQNVIRVGSLEPVRDFVDVRDVAKAYLMLAASGDPGEFYNVCSGVGVAMRQCLELLIGQTKVPLRIDSEQGRVQAHDVPAQIGDYGHLRRATGWRPEITLEKSLADLLEGWRLRQRKG
jgi:GDP-4-dehydro-6-deoxy-D-mannose reductase